MSIYLYHGEEDFLVEEAVQAIETTCPEFERIRFQSNTPLAQVLDAVSTPSLFSKAKLFLGKDLSFLNQALSPPDILMFQEFCQILSGSQDIAVFYTSGKTVAQRLKQMSYLKTRSQITLSKSFEDWELDKTFQWIKTRVNNSGKTIAFEAILSLEHASGSQLRQLATEIDKLVTYVGTNPTITLADASELSYGKHTSGFAFSDAMKSKDLPKTLAITETLLKNGEDPLKLFGLAVSNIRLFYQILLLLKERKPSAEIAKETEKNPYYLEKIIPFVVKAYSIEKLEAAFVIFSAYDIDIKMGKLSPKMGLELAMIKSLA